MSNQDNNKKIFITDIDINNVRHLKNINIHLSVKERKHLILTGKNGSGKTSVLNAIKNTLEYSEEIQYNDLDLDLDIEIIPKKSIFKTQDIRIKFNNSNYTTLFNKGKFLFVYFDAFRKLEPERTTTIEKVDLPLKSSPEIILSNLLVKFLLQQEFKMLKGFKKSNEDKEALKIEEWFNGFKELLREIYEDNSLTLDSDLDNFKYTIKIKNGNTFDFDQLANGYSSILRIVTELILRMEDKVIKTYDLQGIVLIDEIDLHLHLEMQKKILPFLITLFPNIQFIVTTHSPFILNSIDNAIIYDLENKICVDESLKGLGYEGIVEGYFDVNEYSNDIINKFSKCKELIKKEKLTSDEKDELSDLKLELKEIIKIPWLAPEIALEYERLKKLMRK